MVSHRFVHWLQGVVCVPCWLDKTIENHSRLELNNAVLAISVKRRILLFSRLKANPFSSIKVEVKPFTCTFNQILIHKERGICFNFFLIAFAFPLTLFFWTNPSFMDTALYLLSLRCHFWWGKWWQPKDLTMAWISAATLISNVYFYFVVFHPWEKY